jgi:uncharacterized protein (DUF697 family)
MSTGSITSPRPAPSVLVPALGGAAAIVAALPVYLVAGWRLGAWVLAATLWLASQAFGYLLTRLRMRGNLAAAGVAGVGMMTRAIVVMLVAFAVAVSDPWLGLAAALTYAFAYTIELLLSLVSYFGNEPL